jgi:antirestriction protein ArdC
MKTEVYEKITNQIIEALEQGTVAWHKPWKSVGGHRNFNSGKPYRGINVWITALSGFDSPYWNTYRGWRQAAGYERDDNSVGVLAKGTTMTPVLFSNVKEVKDPNAKSGKKKIFWQKAYSVANFDQLLPEIQQKVMENHPKRFQADENQNDPIEDAQAALDAFFEEQDVTLGHGGDKAYYNPGRDHVQLPTMNSFDDSEHYYSTAFHEAAHATGHSSRLDRFEDDVDQFKFASESYSFEELVAEMSAAYLCGHTGIEGTFDNSAAYIANWLTKLKDDRKMIVQAASAAQKAADMIRGVKWDKAPEAAESDSKAAPATA